MDAHQERIGASMNAWQKEMMARQEVTETCLESKYPKTMQIVSVVVREEVPKEEASGDRHLAIGHR
jgi:hypothetical protein